MRQSPHLLQGNHDVARRSNDPRPARSLPVQPPQTPHHPNSGAALDELILSLEDKYRLGLKLRDSSWSPNKDTNRSTADKVYGIIKRLFFPNRPALDSALDRFRERAPGEAHEKQLGVLYDILKSSKAQSLILGAGTPLNEPPESSRSVQMSDQATRRGGLFDGYTRDEPESYHTAFADPGSPTDFDDDEYYTPPSPTRSAVHRRVEASPLTPLPNPRKRPFDPSNHESSSRSTKTLKGKQPVGPDVSNGAFILKTPSLKMAPSFQHADTTAVSTNTSFNTMWSSQRTQDESAATSFTTDGANDDVADLMLTRKSSTILDSREGSDTIAVVVKAENEQFELEKQRESDRISSQGASHESVSTYGSIDEDLLLHATSKAEMEFNQPSAPDSGKGSIRTSGSPSKPTVSPAQPFPEPVVATDAVSANARPPESPTASKTGLVDSLSRMPWYIRELPKRNLFVDELPTELSSCPFFLNFICCRIAIANKVSIQDVMKDLDISYARSSPDFFWSNIDKHLRAVPRDSSAVWAAAKTSFEGYTFKGKVVFQSAHSSPLFRLDLLPIQAETSCLFQRMFGSDRFLYLTFPTLWDHQQIGAQLRRWIFELHSFLGRKWRVFHVEPIKRKRNRRKVREETADTRVILFATEGAGIDRPMSVGKMINEFFDFVRNENQNFCKAFARLDLGLSRTIPTLVFKPSQIRRVPDVFADGTPEANNFNDTSLDWDEKCDELPVMNDGCARVSVGAALKIWQCYCAATGSDEPLPSAFQGRIGGAKGMWMISAEPHTREPAHLETWIEVTDSQRKFEPVHDDEADDRPYSDHRLTFNYVKHSFVNGSTDLHISFIPILVDRGVHRDVIKDIITSRLDQERNELLGMLHDPIRLHNWIAKQCSDTPALGVLTWQAALPLSLPEKAKLLLRAGFSPDQSPYLANLLKRFVHHRQSWMEEKLRAPLGKATFLLGLADPQGVLKPGEVHIQFSKPFLDEFDRKTYRSLDGEEALVARQPACRRSDIQKMRVVSNSLLSHLVDVIVFPSRGAYPAAGKLQGGDYDGDIFWTCWESALVEPFLNAPAPLNALDHNKYRIEKDTRRLNDVMKPYDLSTVDNDFLKEALDFRMAPSLLGKITTFAEKVAYNDNHVHSLRLEALYDVHDLLVDAPKQGYRFDDKDFNHLIQGYGNQAVPAYKQGMEASAKYKVLGQEDTDTSNLFRYNPDNILDFLYFDVIKKHNRGTRQAMKAALSKEFEDDPDLQLPFLQLQDIDSTLKRELDGLSSRFKKIEKDWGDSFGDKTDLLTSDRYNKLMEKFHADFRSIMPSPSNATHPKIASLLFPYLGPDHPTTWEYIRSSALYTEYAAYPKKQTFVWTLAGRELAKIKAGRNPDTYNVVPGVFADLRTKPRKVVKPEIEESDEEYESALEEFVE